MRDLWWAAWWGIGLGAILTRDPALLIIVSCVLGLTWLYHNDIRDMQ